MFVTDLELRATSRPDFWAVVSPLVWETPGQRIIVPKGFLTDLASIPKILRNIFDPDGCSRQPAVMHDWNYRTHTMTREQCDQLLHDSLLACGESAVAAWCYQKGVRLGGSLSYTDHPMGVQPFDFDNIDSFNAWRASK